MKSLLTPCIMNHSLLRITWVFLSQGLSSAFSLSNHKAAKSEKICDRRSGRCWDGDPGSIWSLSRGVSSSHHPPIPHISRMWWHPIVPQVFVPTCSLFSVSVHSAYTGTPAATLWYTKTPTWPPYKRSKILSCGDWIERTELWVWAVGYNCEVERIVLWGSAIGLSYGDWAVGTALWGLALRDYVMETELWRPSYGDWVVGLSHRN